MARRIMFVQLKTGGHETDRGASWIGWVDFDESWNTARYAGRALRRFAGNNSNFFDVDTLEEFWVSDPLRDRTDIRHLPPQTIVDEDVSAAYGDFLAGRELPGRETDENE